MARLPGSTSYPQAFIDRVAELWDVGHTLNAMTDMLSLEFDRPRLTSNAVISLVHRLQLPGRRKAVTVRLDVDRPRLYRRAKQLAGTSDETAAAVLTAELGVPISRGMVSQAKRRKTPPKRALAKPREMSRPCQYIAGDARDAIRRGEDPHCGRPCIDGKPYCAEHVTGLYDTRRAGHGLTPELVGKW